MKKKISFLLIFALIISATLSLFTIGASAATYADDATALNAGYYARIGEAGSGAKYYTSFGLAATDCADGDTIYLIGDFKLSAATAPNITLNKTITIDGQNHTLTGGKDKNILNTYGSKTNTGKVVVKNITFQKTGAGCISEFKDGPAVELENVKFLGDPDYAVTGTGMALVMCKTPVIFKSGEISGRGCMLNTLEGLATVTIEEGVSIDAKTGVAININNADADVKINGGTIYAGTSACGITVSKGKLTINGGDFTAKGGNGMIQAQANGSVIVNGGTFKPEKDNVQFNVAMLLAGAGSQTGGTLTVNGGTFYYPQTGATNKNAVIKAHESSDNNHEVNINGGTFIGADYVYYGGSTGRDAGKRINSLTMLDGASVRTSAPGGIRFRSVSFAADRTAIPADATVTYGTLIAPYDNVDKAGGIFTREAMTAAGQLYVDIVAKDGLVENENGNVDISAALVNLKTENYTRKFVAVTYLSYETESGTVTVYSNYDAEKNVRSIEEVAYKALADVKAEAVEGEYQTVVTEWYELENNVWVKKEGTAYSCYSKAQLAAIEKYIAA